ncbi:unnamed protein product [Spirodela intermedia]|uniref:C2 domain-containing protein n=1 Tax=Spirodela intermedia TaxID=51605 RepID=A0A7I8KS91_SPIIN|nr:unnamed protein product [Spirodela intermedia]
MIELKALSCQDLSLPLFQWGYPPPVYAVVSLGDGGGSVTRKQSQSTPFDRSGGRNPEWNQEIRFDLAAAAADGSSLRSLLLEFDFVVRSGFGGLLGDKIVGLTPILLRDLVEGYSRDACSSDNRFKSVSYKIDSPSRGVLTFRYRVRSHLKDSKLPPRSPPNLQSQSCGSPHGGEYDAPVPPRPAMPSGFYPPLPLSPPATHLYGPLPTKSPTQQLLGATFYDCCPAPLPPSPPPPSSGLYRHADFGLWGREHQISWSPAVPFPAPPADPYSPPYSVHGFPGDGTGAAYREDYGIPHAENSSSMFLWKISQNGGY